jgi:hypothetical protein
MEVQKRRKPVLESRHRCQNPIHMVRPSMGQLNSFFWKRFSPALIGRSEISYLECMLAELFEKGVDARGLWKEKF